MRNNQDRLIPAEPLPAAHGFIKAAGRSPDSRVLHMVNRLPTTIAVACDLP